jgi:streptogramin lyase
MKRFFQSRRGLILLVVLIGFVLRTYAAFQLPVDADEPVYMKATFDYAQFIKVGDWKAVIDYPENPEHPPLVKLLYSLTVLPLSQRAGWSDALLLSRMISVVFGTLGVWLIALINPLAGGLMAVQTMMVKYTSEAYLEAVPLFASLAAVVALYFSKATRDRFFWLSSLNLGLVAAGKYSYFPIVFVVLFLFLVERKYSWRDLLFYLGAAAITFLALDPALWHDPFRRLADSVLFHAQYSQGAHVLEVGYPWYQPLNWISHSWPNIWHPQIFFFFAIDGLIFLLALAGLYFEWRGRRWNLIWILGGVLFLLAWPTKWPQYTLVVIPALCLSASSTLLVAINWARQQEDYWGWFSGVIPRPPRVFLIGLLGTVAILLVFLGANAVSIAQDRRGWSHLLAELTPLPSNTVYAIAAYKDGQMALGTAKGAVIWSPAIGNDVQDHWTILNRQNSGLPDDEVFSVASDRLGGLWFGTGAGLARYDGQAWQVYHAEDWGLPGDEVHAIKIDGTGRLWIGTNAGAAVFDGQSWTSYSAENSGLTGTLVFSLAFDPDGNQVWLGTDLGLNRFDQATGEWALFKPKETGLGDGGIPNLLFDSSGRLWVATLGGGLSMWDGETWLHYRISNSGLQSNSVQAIQETGEGYFWIANSFPERPGGLIFHFDGKSWKTYRPYYSGYSGSQVVSIAEDAARRIWFGTLTAGVDIYQPPK